MFLISYFLNNNINSREIVQVKILKFYVQLIGIMIGNESSPKSSESTELRSTELINGTSTS